MRYVSVKLKLDNKLEPLWIKGIRDPTIVWIELVMSFLDTKENK